MFRKEALEQFTRRGEKTLPPVFVGRGDILQDILDIAHESWVIANHQLPGATRILQGAPGAGKSSILAALQSRTQSSSSGASSPQSSLSHTPTPRILVLGSGRIVGPADILFPLARLVNPDAAPAFLSRYTRTRTVERRAGVMGVGAAGRLEATRTHTDPNPL